MRSATCLVVLIGILLVKAGTAAAQPDPSMSTCSVSIAQAPVVPRCIDNFEPDVIRLSPAINAVPPHDTATFNVVARDATGAPIQGALVSLFEIGSLNIVNGGSTTATTAADGSASISLSAASSEGRVAVCVDGVVLCEAEVRSPDAVRSDVPITCFTSGPGPSAVAGADITHSSCGFLVNFGPVTPGDNDNFDLDCTGIVNGFDINGPSGVLRYFGDTGTLGAKNSCP